MKLRLALALLCLLTLRVAADDESDFTAAPPANWTRSNSIGTATFTFTGGIATITGTPPAPAQVPLIGLARGGVIAPTSYTDGAASVDVVAWGAQRVFASVVTRFGTPGLGTSRGYSLTLIPSTGEVQMHRLAGEIPTIIAPTQFITVESGTAYRLVLLSVGSKHTARVFRANDLRTPLVAFSAVDATYASGRCGFVASTDQYNAISASFDNFLAWPGVAAPLNAFAAPDFAGQIAVETDARRSTVSRWESTPELGVEPWNFDTPISGTHTGNVVRANFIMSGTQRFYRLRVLE